jgi:hypothetical protein
MKRNTTVRLLRDICKEYKVRIRFVHLRGFDGECALDGKTIFVNKKASCKGMAQIVFHELGHAYCIKNGVWKMFHKSQSYPPMKSFIAENWIEWWAKREWDRLGMRRLFGQYQFAYLKKNKKKLVKWISTIYK